MAKGSKRREKLQTPNFVWTSMVVAILHQRSKYQELRCGIVAEREIRVLFCVHLGQKVFDNGHFR